MAATHTAAANADEMDELADVLQQEGVVQWRERTLEAAVLAPLIAQQQQQDREDGALQQLQSFLRTQHTAFARSNGASSRATKVALAGVTAALGNMRPEDCDELNEDWVQLRLQQQFLVSHLLFHKQQRWLQKQEREREAAAAAAGRGAGKEQQGGRNNGNNNGGAERSHLAVGNRSDSSGSLLTAQPRGRLVLSLGSGGGGGGGSGGGVGGGGRGDGDGGGRGGSGGGSRQVAARGPPLGPTPEQRERFARVSLRLEILVPPY
jgi:hypothetical protein